MLDEETRQRLDAILFEGKPVEEFVEKEIGKEINLDRVKMVNDQHRLIRGHSKYHSGPAFPQWGSQKKQVVSTRIYNREERIVMTLQETYKEMLEKEGEFLQQLNREEKSAEIVLYGMIMWPMIQKVLESENSRYAKHHYNDAGYFEYLQRYNLKIIQNTVRNNRERIVLALPELLETRKDKRLVIVVANDTFYATPMDALVARVMKVKINHHKKNYEEEAQPATPVVKDLSFSNIPDELKGRDALYTSVINGLSAEVKSELDKIVIGVNGNLILVFK